MAIDISNLEKKTPTEKYEARAERRFNATMHFINEGGDFGFKRETDHEKRGKVAKAAFGALGDTLNSLPGAGLIATAAKGVTHYVAGKLGDREREQNAKDLEHISEAGAKDILRLAGEQYSNALDALSEQAGEDNHVASHIGQIVTDKLCEKALKGDYRHLSGDELKLQMAEDIDTFFKETYQDMQKDLNIEPYEPQKNPVKDEASPPSLDHSQTPSLADIAARIMQNNADLAGALQNIRLSEGAGHYQGAGKVRDEQISR